VPGAVIAYRRSGSGAPLLFLHGVGSSKHTWEPQLAHFARSHTALAMDFRGYADSSGEAAEVSLEAFAADAAALDRRLGLGPAHVCGLSMGGIVALTLWRDHPEVVRSLALADAWADHPSAAAAQPARLAQIDASSMAVLAETRMRAVYGPAVAPAVLERGIAVFASLRKEIYRAASSVLWEADLREVAGRVTVPALVLVGESDTITPPDLSRRLAALIPGAALVLIPRAGHLANEENPAAFNAALQRFLEQPLTTI